MSLLPLRFFVFRVDLHFEILTGNYNNPRGSKGLAPRNPFEFPAYNPGS